MKKTTPIAEKVKMRLSQLIESGDINNDDLVHIIELCGSYLNLTTRSNYVKENKISYNSAKHYRKNVYLFKTNFIIDNA